MSLPSFDLGFPLDLPPLDEVGLALLESLKADIDCDILGDISEPHIASQVQVNVQGGPSFEFLDVDEKFMKLLAEGGSNPSAGVNNWARNRFDKFRVFRGLSIDRKFESLPYSECSSLLTYFFAQVTKTDGQLYPSQTLMGLYRAFHRLLKRSQELRVQESGVDEIPFSMRTSPLFKSVGISCVLAMERSKKLGADLPRKKSGVISLADENTILRHASMNPVHARGLQARAIYYLLCRFAIRGGQELYKLGKQEFTFGSDEGGRFVRYDERLSKNYRVSLDRYQDEHFRPAVTSHDMDMVATIESLISHLPISGVFLFYQCIDSPRTHAWYSTLRVSAKKLAGFLRMLHKDCGLTGDAITNKSGRTTCVTRMCSEGVPPAVGMRITGHKSQGAYTRYDRSLEAQVRAAQLSVGQGTSYATNFNQETSLFKNKVISGDVGSGDALQSVKRIKIAETAAIPTAAIVEIRPDTTEVEPEELEATKAAGSIVTALPMGILAAAGHESTEDDHAGKNELGWMDGVDWDNIMSPYDTPTIINPINAFFGKIGSMSQCTFNITVNKS